MDIDLVSLSGILIDKMLNEAKIDKKLIDELIIGSVLTASRGQNIARQIQIKAGIPKKVPAYVVDMVCGSSMKAMNIASNSILANETKIVLVGGVEFMSDAKFMQEDGLFCSLTNESMGYGAERLVEKYALDRKELDIFSLESTKKAIKARDLKYFDKEIVKIKGHNKDEHIRDNQSMEKLESLKPVFKENGSITAGNSTGLNDGAAFLVLADSEFAKKMGFEILAYIEDFVTVGLDPKYMGLGPVFAIRKLLEKNRLNILDIDLFEINEAFAAQVLACVKELGIDKNRLNVNGGAIALGHPIGVAGARITTTLIYEMKRRKAKRAIASLCVGGGQGIAVLLGENNECWN